jgi:hypothetical protein
MEPMIRKIVQVVSVAALCLLWVAPAMATKKGPTTQSVSCKKTICALYGLSAKSKAAWGCGLRKFKGNCSCTKTSTTCGTNWRGKTKHNFACTCTTTAKEAAQAKKTPASPEVGETCRRTLCSLYKTTAKGKVAWKCGLRKYRGNCYCKKTPVACGKNWRGKIKYNYDCFCRAACNKTVCATYSLTAQGKAAWTCGWKKGYSTRRCKCKQTTTCGKNWRGKHKYNYDCRCK